MALALATAPSRWLLIQVLSKPGEGPTKEAQFTGFYDLALGLAIETLVYARPFWMRYGDIHRQDLEREAFTIQTQPNRFELITSSLKSYC